MAWTSVVVSALEPEMAWLLSAAKTDAKLVGVTPVTPAALKTSGLSVVSCA